MINDHHEAALCDFGVARMLDDVVTGFTTSNPAMSLPFASPELLDGERGRTYTDVYAFAGLCLQVCWPLTQRAAHFKHSSNQVLSGEPPHYKKRKNVAHITLAIATGKLPEPTDHPINLPRHALEALWALLRRCWATAPADRPPMSEVMGEVCTQAIDNVVRSFKPSSQMQRIREIVSA